MFLDDNGHKTVDSNGNKNRIPDLCCPVFS